MITTEIFDPVYKGSNVTIVRFITLSEAVKKSKHHKILIWFQSLIKLITPLKVIMVRSSWAGGLKIGRGSFITFVESHLLPL